MTKDEAKQILRAQAKDIVDRLAQKFNAADIVEKAADQMLKHSKGVVLTIDDLVVTMKNRMDGPYLNMDIFRISVDNLVHLILDTIRPMIATNIMEKLTQQITMYLNMDDVKQVKSLINIWLEDIVIACGQFNNPEEI